MGLEKAVVDGGDDGEESDGLLGLVCQWEERGSESRPDGVDGKGEEKFDCTAGEERCEEGIHGAMNVVEWKDVEEMVVWRVVPCGIERLCLSHEN